MALTKSDIISTINDKTDLSNKQSIAAVENIIEIIKSTLEAGGDILFSGFGKFYIMEKDARLGRNPASGNDMILPARKVVCFRCSEKLKKRINGK